MEITDLRCVRREGTLTGVDSHYSSRVVRPVDVYEEFRTQSDFYSGARTIPQAEDGELDIVNLFLEIETDEGITGLASPITESDVYFARRLADLLIGRDPIETETLWDLLYRQEVHGRKGAHMMAISVIDCALWDIKGKYYDEPVHRLLGGPTRDEIPVYTSMWGLDLDPDAVREAAAEMKDRGHPAQKWFFQHGPGSGEAGKQANVALAEAARDGVGDDHDLMFDCWMSWDRSYSRDMIDRLAPYEPRWLEEPVHADKIDVYAELREYAPFPIAGGEHEYTRWGLYDLLSRNAVDVAQLDTYWAGGISELDKVCTLGSVYDVPVIPHGMSVPANVQVSAAQSPTVCPWVEYLVRQNETFQFFFEDPVAPEDGTVDVPDEPGMGVRIDDSKVEAEREVEL